MAGTLADNFVGGGAFLRPMILVEPDNRARRTTIYGLTLVMRTCVVDNGQIGFHFDQAAGCIFGAAGTGGATDFAIGQYRVAEFEVLARDPETVADRLK